MDTDFNIRFAEMIEQNLDNNVESTAELLEEEQWASACSVVHTEEERSAVMSAPKKVKYTFMRDDTSFDLIRKVTEEPLIMNLITKGKDTPYTKGKGNPVQQLDGSTEPSKSITEGTPLPWLSWNAVPIEDDVLVILRDIVPQLVNDAVSQANSQFSETVIKPWISQQFNEIIGGES